MARFINPFTDVGFKRIFGQEINKDLLIDFLNGLLEGEKHIVDIRFLDKEVLPAFAQDRGVIYDVYCTNESGEQFIVEMQNRPQVNFRERALYYLSRAVARQGERGVLAVPAQGRVWCVFHELLLGFRFTQVAYGYRPFGQGDA